MAGNTTQTPVYVWWWNGTAMVPASTTDRFPVDVGTITANTSAEATAAPPTYVEGTENPLSQNLTGDLRVIAKQSGTWNIGTVTTLTGITNAVGIKGVDGATIATVANPVPVSSSQVGGTTLSSTQVIVPATANGIQIAASGSRKSLTVYNGSAVNVYIAQTNAVTTASGYIPPGQSYNTNYTGALFGIVAAATQTVSVQEET